jgi:hypothetical protein
LKDFPLCSSAAASRLDKAPHCHGFDFHTLSRCHADSLPSDTHCTLLLYTLHLRASLTANGCSRQTAFAAAAVSGPVRFSGVQAPGGLNGPFFLCKAAVRKVELFGWVEPAFAAAGWQDLGFEGCGVARWCFSLRVCVRNACEMWVVRLLLLGASAVFRVQYTCIPACYNAGNKAVMTGLTELSIVNSKHA